MDNIKMETIENVVNTETNEQYMDTETTPEEIDTHDTYEAENHMSCLLYTSPSPRDRQKSRMPSSA